MSREENASAVVEVENVYLRGHRPYNQSGNLGDYPRMIALAHETKNVLPLSRLDFASCACDAPPL